MRVAIMANARSPHTQRWATSLSARGHEVHVVSIHSGKIAGATVHRIGVGGEVSTSPIWALLSYLRLLIAGPRLVRRLRPDVVNPHYATTHGVAASRVRGLPIVLTLWGSDIARGDDPVSGWRRVLAVRAIGAAHIVTSASSFMVEIVNRIVDRDLDIRVVPFGVDPSSFRPAQRANSQYTVMFVKALFPKYAPDVLLRAFDLSVKRGSTARLVIVGDGPLRHTLEKDAASQGLSDRVEFRGRVPHDEVPAMMAEADVLVNPSRSESFGAVILEAAAMGVPVVATRVGGTVETVIDGESGLLVPVDDEESLAEALLILERDERLRRQMGAAAQRLAATFDWSRCVDAMLDAYQAAITQHGRA